jgi:hypothetical protein
MSAHKYLDFLRNESFRFVYTTCKPNSTVIQIRSLALIPSAITAIAAITAVAAVTAVSAVTAVAAVTALAAFTPVAAFTAVAAVTAVTTVTAKSFLEYVVLFKKIISAVKYFILDFPY